MKKVKLLLALILPVSFFGQQGLSIIPKVANPATFAPAVNVVDFNQLSNWGLVGIGNLNLETLKDVNAAAKISGYKRLYKDNNQFTTVYFSLNKNAINNDSLLAGTFLFPDVGNASAAFTLEHLRKIGNVRNNNINLIGGFFDFSYKNIKAERDKVKREFSTLGYAFGIKYLNWYHDAPNSFDFIFSITFYLSIVNVPDEDNEDYRALFAAPNLKSAIGSNGVKIGIQVNNLQFFADLKSTIGNENNVPVRALRGFNANIGFILNASVFER